MRIKGFGFVAVLAMSLLHTTPATAAPVPCVGCQTTEEFREAAASRGPGTHNVYNIATNVMQTWRVPEGYITNIGGAQDKGALAISQGQPTQTTNPTGALTELARAHEVYVLGGGTLRPIIVVPHTQLGLTHTQGRTIQDVVWDNNLRNQIASAAASVELISTLTSAGFLNALADLTSLAASSLGLRDQGGIMVRLVMQDGGYIDIKVDIDESVGNVLIDTARTASGQFVPSDLSQTNGTWTSSRVDNLGAMASHFTLLGAQMQYAGSGTVIRSIVCAGSVCIITTTHR